MNANLSTSIQRYGVLMATALFSSGCGQNPASDRAAPTAPATARAQGKLRRHSVPCRRAIRTEAAGSGPARSWRHAALAVITGLGSLSGYASQAQSHQLRTGKGLRRA